LLVVVVTHLQHESEHVNRFGGIGLAAAADTTINNALNKHCADSLTTI
jgi:hypothetical protein